ncbi:hypothetical protein RKLH11_66 [Rhodobacteraceae bacterium KLH11]|nr:hypothetical protein RKLH11_66 [Rhodobacteraceae bacterium KLH11]
MSLTMMALRISAIQALKAGKTLVGDSVLDSQISVFDQTADGSLSTKVERPFIAVYTDSAKSEDLEHSGLRANGMVEMLFNCGVSMTMAQTNKETGETYILQELPATDANFEAVLDVLGVQIGRALSNPDNEWAQVFGNFVKSYGAKECVRSSSTADNVRLAAAQIKLTVEVFADPIHGQELSDQSPWRRFLSLMERDAIRQLTLFQDLLGVADPATVFDYERLTGMTVQTVEDLRLGGFEGVARTGELTEVEDSEDRA